MHPARRPRRMGPPFQSSNGHVPDSQPTHVCGARSTRRVLVSCVLWLRCVCVPGTKVERRMRDGSLRTDSKDVGTASWLLNDRSRRSQKAELTQVHR